MGAKLFTHEKSLLADFSFFFFSNYWQPKSRVRPLPGVALTQVYTAYLAFDGYVPKHLLSSGRAQ